MEQRNDLLGVGLVLGAGVLWATVGPAQVFADSPAGPVALGGARILAGGLVLALVVLATRRDAFRTLTRSTWPSLLAASCATGVFQAAFMSSVARTGAAVATAVTFGVVPVSTGIVERLALGTRLSRGWAVGTCAAIAGCALVMTPDGPVHVDTYGVLLGVASGGCYGVYTVAAKRLTGGRADMTAAVAVTLLIGGSFLAPWTLSRLPALGTARSLLVVGWLGPVTAALAYSLFVAGLRRVTAATAGTLSLAEPLVATALAVLFLGERMSVPVAAGSVLLLGGLVLVSVPGRPSRRSARTGGLPDGPADAPRVRVRTGPRRVRRGSA
ncbi:DMT family transporter [Actinoallomurus rhizosphaericola]|uniref:DMT family transporter n=1 Tax=Actinoallomurus rhizosphaericola TaxID=2952536 RepID=UPI002090ABA0|nr:EamA family transporter [Actinoallomurus rhizosphaericola]MCO5992267.1 DMT family transporter [Actinoallomurus rhizosphaericola]